MTRTVLHQVAGLTIARSDEAATLVPYGEARHADGNINHGWVDLRDHPERVKDIPEAQRSAGLARLLSAIADPVSKIMSSACECHAFNRQLDARGGLAWQVGGFVMTMFKDPIENTKSDNLVDLALYLAQRIVPTDQHIIAFEFIVEPLMLFFGRRDCFALMIKPLGHGDTKVSAWAAFDCDRKRARRRGGAIPARRAPQ